VQPWGIVNAAGYVRVDDAEFDPGRCFRENAIGAGLLASECAARGISLLTFSSDLVFSGKQTHPYLESDAPAPLNQYGASKAEGERRVLEAMPGALVVRSSAFFGPWDEYNFLNIALRTLAAGQEFRCAYDATVSPTYVPDLVHASLDLLIDGERGIWHLANPGETTWAEFAANAATAAGVPLKSLRLCTLQELGLPAERPQYSVLGSERAVLLPPLTDALARFMGEIDVDRYLDPLAA
jgi:dTDP-4-dehydrorhamnose reductase